MLDVKNAKIKKTRENQKIFQKSGDRVYSQELWKIVFLDSCDFCFLEFVFDFLLFQDFWNNVFWVLMFFWFFDFSSMECFPRLLEYVIWCLVFNEVFVCFWVSCWCFYWHSYWKLSQICLFSHCFWWQCLFASIERVKLSVAAIILPR